MDITENSAVASVRPSVGGLALVPSEQRKKTSYSISCIEMIKMIIMTVIKTVTVPPKHVLD